MIGVVLVRGMGVAFGPALSKVRASRVPRVSGAGVNRSAWSKRHSDVRRALGVDSARCAGRD